MINAVVSIHDVMPDTLNRVQKTLVRINKVPPQQVYLLVVPGLNWSQEQIQTLLELEQAGYQIAGHGWTHQIHKKTSLFHFLHSMFISRNVAEHLSLSKAELFDLVERNHQWFTDHGFQPPQLYVPPAWAMGKLTNNDLSRLPFRYYEMSSGIYDAQSDRYVHLPLTGYEADRYWRIPILKLWNSLNLWLSKKKPTRISIHPYDYEYPMAKDIDRHINLIEVAFDCDTLFQKVS